MVKIEHFNGAFITFPDFYSTFHCCEASSFTATLWKWFFVWWSRWVVFLPASVSEQEWTQEKQHSVKQSWVTSSLTESKQTERFSQWVLVSDKLSVSESLSWVPIRKHLAGKREWEGSVFFFFFLFPPSEEVWRGREESEGDKEMNRNKTLPCFMFKLKDRLDEILAVKLFYRKMSLLPWLLFYQNE